MGKRLVSFRELVALNSSISYICNPCFCIDRGGKLFWEQLDSMPLEWSYVRVDGKVFSKETILKYDKIKSGEARKKADILGL